MPSIPLPQKNKPLRGAEARQAAAALMQWARRKPRVKLSFYAELWLNSVRRGKYTLGYSRWENIRAYVERRKRELTPRPLQIQLASGQPRVSWGDSLGPMGNRGGGPGNALPPVPQGKIQAPIDRGTRYDRPYQRGEG